MKHTIVGFLVGATLGGLAVGFYSHSMHQRELAGAFFGAGLADAVSASATLEMIDEGRVSTARKINQLRLDGAIDSSYRWMVEYQPAISPVSTPNIHQGLVDLHAELSVRQPERRETLWLQQILVYIQQNSGAAG